MKLTILSLAACLSITFSSCYKSGYVQPRGFSDDFNADNYGWSYNDAASGGQIYIANGLLTFQFFPPGNGASFAATGIGTGWNRNYSNWDIKTSISTDNTMGLAWGLSATDNGYSFLIDKFGQFSVYDEGQVGQPATAATLIPPTPSNTIHSGYNTLEMQQSGNAWFGYINGVQVFNIPAHQLYGDKIGFEVLANTDGYADYLDISY